MNNAWSALLATQCKPAPRANSSVARLFATASNAIHPPPHSSARRLRSTLASLEAHPWRRIGFCCTSRRVGSRSPRYFASCPRVESQKTKKAIDLSELDRSQASQLKHKEAAKKPPEKPRKENWTREIDNGEVFGHPLPVESGHSIIKEIQRRRTVGSLADTGLTGLKCSEAEAGSALEWLRNHYPLDEEAIAAKWASAEADRLDQTLLHQAQKIGLLKKDEDYVDSPPNLSKAVDGGSVLLQRQSAIKREKQQREEEETKQRLDAVDDARRAQGPKYVMPWNNAELREANKERYSKWEVLRKRAELRTDDIFANRSAFSRLWGPTLMGMSVAAMAAILASLYVPPLQDNRLWPNVPPAISTCFMIAALNVAVFIAWRAPKAWYSMNRLFMLSAGHPNSFSIVGNTFSHQQWFHLAQNMFFLFLVGPLVHEQIGRGNFVALYLGTGIFGSLFNLYINVLTRNFAMASVGASGSLVGLLGAYFVLQEQHHFRVPFTDIKFEFSSKVGLACWLILEIVGFAASSGKVDHLSHLGGMIAGLVGGWWLKNNRATGNTIDGKDGSIDIATMLE